MVVKGLKKDKSIFNNYPKEISNLFNLSLAALKHANDPIWLPKHVGGISQGTMEKCGRLIYVNANKLRYRMMLIMRIGLAGSRVATTADWS